MMTHAMMLECKHNLFFVWFLQIEMFEFKDCFVFVFYFFCGPDSRKPKSPIVNDFIELKT